MTGAIEKYNRRVDKTDSLVCVSLDPELARLPERFGAEEFPQFAFNKEVIDATHEFVSAYKPTFAFYEAGGSKGFEELQMTVSYIRKQYPGILTIGDGKRGDIGHANEQYAAAIYDEFGFDATTLQPYFGRESLEPFLKRKDKGCIVLCRTSNLGAREIQDLLVRKKPLWHAIAEMVAREWNMNGNCMLVAGATYPKDIKTIRSLVGDMPLLVPGIGAQGGDVKAVVQAGVDSQGRGLVINAGRSIIFSENPAKAARTLRDEINRWRGLSKHPPKEG